ncbi:MAG: Rieske 2Fe-2S domain-containing protein [Phycisphaeraceae bacterium]
MTKHPSPSTNHQPLHSVWVDLCAWEQVPTGGGKYVVYQEHPLAVVRVGDDAVRVIDDTCPHAGGSLSAGHIDPALGGPGSPGCIVCPWHAWPFDLDSGKCPDNPVLHVRTYPARVANGRVMAKVSPARAPAPDTPIPEP